MTGPQQKMPAAGKIGVVMNRIVLARPQYSAKFLRKCHEASSSIRYIEEPGSQPAGLFIENACLATRQKKIHPSFVREVFFPEPEQFQKPRFCPAHSEAVNNLENFKLHQEPRLL